MDFLRAMGGVLRNLCRGSNVCRKLYRLCVSPYRSFRQRMRGLHSDYRLALQFLGYGWRQFRLYLKYRKLEDPFFESCVNYKRAHYLEKAMYCELPRSETLNQIYRGLHDYVESQTIDTEPNIGYLRKMVREYSAYPDTFRCFMLDIPLKPLSEEKARVVEMALRQRRSIRSFKNQPIPNSVIERLIAAATYAPSSCNAQPLHYIILREPQLIYEVFSAAQGARAWAENIPCGILVVADRRPYKPFMQHIVMAQDIAAATQNLLLMAHSLGLGACWVTLLSDSHFIGQGYMYRQLNLPEYMYVGAAIAVGYPASAICHVPRRPPKSVLHFDVFCSKEESTPSASEDPTCGQ